MVFLTKFQNHIIAIIEMHFCWSIICGLTYSCCLQFKPDPRFEEAKKLIRSGAFGSYDYNPLLDSLEGNTGYGRGDYFLVGHDFPSYIDAQSRVDEAYE